MTEALPEFENTRPPDMRPVYVRVFGKDQEQAIWPEDGGFVLSHINRKTHLVTLTVQQKKKKFTTLTLEEVIKVADNWARRYKL